jgi:hypothetical protein
VFVNAKWIARASGSWTIPGWKVNVAAFYNTRQGYPYIRSELTAPRPFSAGTATVYLEQRLGLDHAGTFTERSRAVRSALAGFGRALSMASERRP